MTREEKPAGLMDMVSMGRYIVKSSTVSAPLSYVLGNRAPRLFELMSMTLDQIFCRHLFALLKVLHLSRHLF